MEGDNILKRFLNNVGAESTIMQLEMKCHITPKAPPLITELMSRYSASADAEVLTMAGLENPVSPLG